MTAVASSGRRRPVAYGGLAAAGLLLLYFAILSIANSPSHAVEQFVGMWYWILLLAIGFGVQVGFFVYAKAMHLAKPARASVSVAGSAGVSSVSMAACCAHHLSDVFPLLGLSASAIFLVKYQTSFILAGVFSNALGILFLLKEMQKHGLYHKDSLFFRRLFMVDMRKAAYITGVIAFVIVGLVTYTQYGGW